MTTVAPELYQKYGRQGEATLTSCFIKNFFEHEGKDTSDPAVLQILNFRKINSGKENDLSCAHVRLSDGSFRYSSCYFADQLREQVDAMGLENDPPGGERKDYPVIAIEQYHLQQFTQNDNKTKDAFIIDKFHFLISVDYKLGSPNTHKGLENSKHFLDFTTNSVYSVPFGIHSAKSLAIGRNPAGVNLRPPGLRRQGSSFGITNVTPVKMITPYLSKWRIAGIVSAREELREINTRNGMMNVFNFDITDKDGDAIRIAAFGDAALKAYSVIQSDSSYYIAGGTVKQANRRFNSTGHDYELTLRTDTEITPCPDLIPPPRFHLNVCKLDRVVNHKDEMIDVLAVCDKLEPLTEFTSRAGKPMTKREMSLIDQTGTVVQMVLWGEQARNFGDNALGQVIGIKGATVKEWNGGFSLGCAGGTKWELTPTLPEVPKLYEWYTRDRPTMETRTITASFSGGGGEAFARDLRFIGTATALQLGNEPDLASGRYMNLKGMVTSTKHDSALYQACSSEGCQKKVVELDGQYRCEKCNTNSDTFKWNYMVSLEVSDSTGSLWLTLFSKAAEKLFGKTAQELGELKEANPDEFARVLDGVRFKNKMWRVRGRAETYNEETRVRFQGFDVNDIDYDKYMVELEKTLQLLDQL